MAQQRREVHHGCRSRHRSMGKLTWSASDYNCPIIVQLEKVKYSTKKRECFASGWKKRWKRKLVHCLCRFVTIQKKLRIQFQHITIVHVEFGWNRGASYRVRHRESFGMGGGNSSAHTQIFRGSGGGSGRKKQCQRCIRIGAMSLLQSSPALSLLTFNSLTFSGREHFLVFNSKLAATDFTTVQSVHHQRGLVGQGEVCKRKPPEHSVVEMVVERIGKRKAQLGHHVQELFFLDRERNIFDHNGGGNEVVIIVVIVVIIVVVFIIVIVISFFLFKRCCLGLSSLNPRANANGQAAGHVAPGLIGSRGRGVQVSRSNGTTRRTRNPGRRTTGNQSWSRLAAAI
ncbi:hypothetical protein PGUG_01670 [Meyerozyma guilliermondii ATCC 6260]|uniref:Uncharacterized protein n=1 Tax=Meyerozyma guilliermondii (strain ATCC 6260 / CBS 566 / DSM 6381 / JCM 1539 / NBRC 10279 / NRRL Y-324) TaxID=294746 RepID=A5DEG9_PICGU|nr:uncharacterized protein PGUG_01670 [Meyerozyma guilliermondii ATCC 6260]EDK37572.2 hypothetical protein PGUG_01670 [Meyerozyma guilliermondii ATCC 6260]